MEARITAECGMSDRHMLLAGFAGKVSGIVKGFSMPDDANQAMCQVCDALVALDLERAKSFDAEDGPFASTFAIYAEEAREKAAEIGKARERWEISNADQLLQSIQYLLGHLIGATSGLEREHIYRAGRAICEAQDARASKTIISTKRGAGPAQQAPAHIQ